MSTTHSGYLLGYDVGSSSIKVCLVSAGTGEVVGSATSPDQELPMKAPQEGWAEQHPDLWWEHAIKATQQLKAKYSSKLEDVAAIGISYQMHGLVMIDKDQKPLRPSIIWCDSRAVSIGRKAFEKIGSEFCLSHYLNSPGNFTASKLRWVQEHEPEIYEKTNKVMLPGDYLALKMSGEAQTTLSGLSEGILWDFKEQHLAQKLLDYYQIDASLISEVVPTFAEQAELSAEAAQALGLKKGIKIAYRAGDQPNNALSLNVLEPGEVATTAGTSGVIYGISDRLEYDPQSRVNTFAHVNYDKANPRYGILACVNGTGILNSWMKNQMMANKLSYEEMNQLAAEVPAGAAGMTVIPFGNGAERTLGNKDVGGHISGLQFNTHTNQHVLRAVQEGIVFALKYSFDIMQEMGMQIQKVKAGKANMFLSPVFREAFANTTGATVELYNTDGSVGAARGAGIGAGVYSSFQEAFSPLQKVETLEPDPKLQPAYAEAYERWLETLQKLIR